MRTTNRTPKTDTTLPAATNGWRLWGLQARTKRDTPARSANTATKPASAGTAATSAMKGDKGGTRARPGKAAKLAS